MDLDTHELAWAAGFFDGEGSTYAQLRKYDAKKSGLARQHRRLIVEAGQADTETLGRLVSATGYGRVYGPYPRKTALGKYDQYQWRVTGWVNANAVLKLLWPWLSTIKRRQAEAAIELCREWQNTERLRGGPRRGLPVQSGYEWQELPIGAA